MDIAKQLTQITLGMDQLYRKQKGGEGVLDREGLVPVILTDSPPSQFASWDDADARLVELASRLNETSDTLRRAYVAEMVESLRGLVATFRGDQQTYIERVERCLRVSASRVSVEIIDGYRDEIGRLLRRMGYVHGTLGECVMRWEAENKVPADKVPVLLNELLAKAHQRSDEKIFPMPDLKMTPVGVSGVPFAAYCDYMNRELRINLDFAYTRPALKHLACHEAFPGHAVHLAVREERTKSGQMPLDAALVVTSSASSPLFEGIGENGIFFLDWIKGPEDGLAMTLNHLRSGARVNAAMMIHHENKPLDQVKTYLEETCYASPAWVEARLAFLTHSLRAPFIFAYWCGDMAVERVWRRVESNQRQEFFRYLYHNMHTVTTLDAFWHSDPLTENITRDKPRQ